MSKKSLIIIGIIVAIAVVGGIILSTGDSASNRSNVSGSATSSDSFSPNLIDAAHEFNSEDNIHTVAGETTVPTPCHELLTDVTVAESAPEQVAIHFSTRVSDPSQTCAQVVTSRRFKVTFNASADASITARFNNQLVELNLREVGPGESLDDFEVYTKG